MAPDTWAVVLGTVVGPIAAVVITRVLDWRNARRDRRLFVFRTLMATRKVAINYDHVTALNVVEVEFYGVKPVIAAWKTYIEHLNNRQSNASEDVVLRWLEKRVDLLAQLLSEMGKFLGMPTSEIDLRNGGYAPDAWRYQEAKAEKMKDFVIRVAEGSARVPVDVFNGEQRAPDPALMSTQDGG